MDTRRKQVDTKTLLDAYRELLPMTQTLPLTISGNSMAPFLVHERDTVYLTRIRGLLKVGDMVLYQRDDGTYVLHRIHHLEQDRYCMVGDAQTILEHGVRREQIVAIVCRVIRKGKTQAPGSFWWEFFEKIWIRMVPLRPAAHRVYAILYRLFRRNAA